MSLVYLKENRTFFSSAARFSYFWTNEQGQWCYNHSQVCCFGLAKPVWPSGILQGDRQKGKGTIRKRKAAHPPPPALSQSTKTAWRHSTCGRSASWLCRVLKIKISACFFFGGQREPHHFSRGDSSGEERVIGPMWPHTGPFFWIWSARPVRGELNQHHKHSERGWLWSREVRERPSYMASGPGGSLKSLAADTSLLMCLSSVMPASWRQVWDREGTWPSVLNPASVRVLVYMGRPMEISQSDTDETHPGEKGFLQISVSPPLGIWVNKERHFIKTARATRGGNFSCPWTLLMYYAAGLWESDDAMTCRRPRGAWRILSHLQGETNSQGMVWGSRRYLELDLTPGMCPHLQTESIYISGYFVSRWHVLQGENPKVTEEATLCDR